MSKIYGDENTIKRAQDAKPGDKSIYINWDAIKSLPDEYEVVITEVTFNTSKLDESFSDVGNDNYMPSPALHYKIAEAKGISGGENSLNSAIYEDVNLSEMTMESVPKFIKMLTGYQVTKFSTVMEEDGTIRRSSPCTIPYNVWNRCVEMWMKEEETTEGYKDNLQKYKIVRGSKSWDLYPKYNTKFKRKSHFYSELKFAQQKAETKAQEKTIRELAGLMTGYRKEDLASGRLIFAKVRRSREILQAETAARLNALSQGVQEQPEAQKMLFSPSGGTIEVVEETEPDTEPEPSNRDKLIKALKFYLNEKTVELDETVTGTVKIMLKWLNDTPDAETNDKYWDKAMGNLKKIEDGIPEFARFNHGLSVDK